MIYFIECMSGRTQYIKIGFSDNPEQRIKELQTGNPIKLKLLATMPGCKNMEKQFHAYFETTRVENSEWFKVRKNGRLYHGVNALSGRCSKKIYKFIEGKIINLQSFLAYSYLVDLFHRHNKYTKKNLISIKLASDRKAKEYKYLLSKLKDLQPSLDIDSIFERLKIR